MTTRSSAASTQNNTTSMFGTGGGLFGNKTSSNTFGSTSNQQGSTGMFGSVLQPSNLNNSNTNNGGLFSQNPNDAQKAQTGMFGSSLNLGKENTTTNGGLTSGLGISSINRFKLIISKVVGKQQELKFNLFLGVKLLVQV